MKLRDLFREIESTKFQSRYMLFSGFKLVRKALSNDPTIALLINEMCLHPKIIDSVGKQLLTLFAKHKNDPGAAYDVAVAAYLYCLYKTDQHFAKRMSEYVLQMGKLWWSVDLALHIKKNMEMFAQPGKWNYKFYRDPTPTEHTSWGPRVQSIRLNENVPFIVNGEKRWNISGQYFVRSPQKTETLMHSV